MNSHFLPCDHCGAINKMPVEKLVKEPHPNCGKCGKKINHHNFVVNATDGNFDKLISKIDLPLIVDFWAAWCGPCKFFAPVFEQTAKEYLGKFVFVKLNTEEQPATSAKYSIRSIPTLMVFKQGQRL
ncbi:MAG: thioredoxin TrxC, partial [Bacteriovoracaceae bacterium]